MTSIVLFVIACGALRTGYAYLLALILLFFAGPMLRRKAICCNFLLLRSFWLLLFGGVFYVMFGKSGLGGVQSYILLPLAAYAIGWNITEDARRRAANQKPAAGHCVWLCRPRRAESSDQPWSQPLSAGGFLVRPVPGSHRFGLPEHPDHSHCCLCHPY